MTPSIAQTTGFIAFFVAFFLCYNLNKVIINIFTSIHRVLWGGGGKQEDLPMYSLKMLMVKLVNFGVRSTFLQFIII